MNAKTSSKKKASKKKASKKTALEKNFENAPNPTVQKFRLLAQVELTPGVEEILKSNEAKLYLTAIDRAAAKLKAMIDREAVVRRHPSHAQSSG